MGVGYLKIQLRNNSSTSKNVSRKWTELQQATEDAGVAPLAASRTIILVMTKW